jgi:hypothetical protein
MTDRSTPTVGRASARAGLQSRQKLPALIPFLIFVSATFIGILIFAYIEAKKANPQMIQVGEIHLTNQA